MNSQNIGSNLMIIVSVIVPCYNEERTIRLLLTALKEQSYPIADFEVVIADGMSTDGTLAEIAAFQAQNPSLNIRVLDNQKHTIPSGLNLAIEAAHGDIIVRLDAHSVPDREYVIRCVENLEKGLGDNIGGVWQIQPGADTRMAESIAAAAEHPLGVGDALYRYTDTAAVVDTVPFGAFHKELVERIGGFDETLLANEDYEFNTRIRQAGGKVWLDPTIRSRYFARSNLGALAKQYWRYGYWKVRMLRRYPGSLRWRQAMPPLFVLSLLSLAFLSFWFVGARWLLGVEVVSYSLAIQAAGVQLALKKRNPFHTFGVPMAIATMHLFWGSAFLWSGVRGKE